MTIKKHIIDSLTEWVIEEGWQISREFMLQIEHELECQGKIPINLLLASQNLAIKWLNFATRN